MALVDDLAAARAALIMIQPEPFNAEAPPAALRGEITPTELHYVRSNFALPPHDGVLEIGGAVEKPFTLTLDQLRAMPAVTRVVTLECAGNGRLAQTPLPVGEPWGHYAVSTAEWTGALLHQSWSRPALSRTASMCASRVPTTGPTTSTTTSASCGRSTSRTPRIRPPRSSSPTR